MTYSMGGPRDSMFGGRHGSLIGILSGGLGFRKMFDDQKSKTNVDSRRSLQDENFNAPREQYSGDMGSPRVSQPQKLAAQKHLYARIMTYSKK